MPSLPGVLSLRLALLVTAHIFIIGGQRTSHHLGKELEQLGLGNLG